MPFSKGKSKVRKGLHSLCALARTFKAVSSSFLFLLRPPLSLQPCNNFQLMAKQQLSSSTAITTTDNDDCTSWESLVLRFLENVGTFGKNLPEFALRKGSYFNLIHGVVKVNHIERGRITCSVTVKPAVANYFRGLHGGAVASIAESMAVACARTVVAEEKELFLGELGNTYLSAAPENAELEVEAVVVRHGKNVTVTAVEFRMKGTKKLAYISRATFYTMPSANL